MTLAGLFVACGWLMLAFQAVNAFSAAYWYQNTLLLEARTLVLGPCAKNTFTGIVVDCQHARRVLEGSPHPIMHALERTCRSVFVDTFRDAVAEVASGVRALGIIALVCITAFYVSNNARASKKESIEAGAATKASTNNVVFQFSPGFPAPGNSQLKQNPFRFGGSSLEYSKID
jgi:hypothetical protein